MLCLGLWDPADPSLDILMHIKRYFSSNTKFTWRLNRLTLQLCILGSFLKKAEDFMEMIMQGYVQCELVVGVASNQILGGAR